jgi:hypothetical protein
VKAAVVDTNVLVVANGRSPQAGPSCVQASTQALLDLQRTGRIVLDAGWRILREYMEQGLSRSGQPGMADAFFKWVFQNQANSEVCETVEIHARKGSETDFEEFPDSPALAGFDPSDRKFVAVARASPSRPQVMNAVDSDWWDFREPLHRNGIDVLFLCPEQFR